MDFLTSSMVKELDALENISSLLEFIPGSAGAIYDLYKAVGPEMPDELVKTPAKTVIPGLPAHYFNYDEGHAGRFSVPDTNGASAEFLWTMAQTNPAQFILHNLTFRSSAEDRTPNLISAEPLTETESTNGNVTAESDKLDDADEAGGVVKSDEEVRIFIPGLNTVHQPRDGETTTVERLKHYVRVTGLPMSQMHIGTSFDQGDVDIESTATLRTLFMNNLIPNSLKPQQNGNRMHWHSRQIDRVQAGLSKLNMIDTPIKDNVKYILDLLINKSEDDSSLSAPVVFIAYSRGSIEIEAALRSFITDSELEKAELERRLRDKVTVMTVGTATDNFPDGPAYIHLAAWNDPLASQSGITARHNPQGGGADALFLNCDSPYNPEAFDNHNFSVVTSQYLSIVLALNDASGLRELWELANQGKLIIPDDGDQHTRAMIQLTRGFDHLWNAEAAWKDVPFGALPDRDAAEKILIARLGEGFVQRVREEFAS